MQHWGKKENVIFLLLKTHKENKLEDLASGFCGEVVFVPRDIIVFYQFIVNSGFGYNLSVVIFILL